MRSSALWIAPCVMALAACNEAAFDVGPHSDAGAPARDAGSSTASPAPPAHAEGTAKRVERKEDVRLTGYRVDAKPGDFMIEGAGSVAVVSRDKGRLIDLGPADGIDEIFSVEPAVFDALDKMHTEVANIEVTPDAHAIHVVKRVLDKPLELHLYYYFDDGALKVDSIATSTGDKPVLAITLGEIPAWGNVLTWVDGHGFIASGGSYPGEFIGREGKINYALCSMQSRLVARFDGEDSPGFHEPAQTGEVTESVPVGGASARRTIAITHSNQSMGAAALALPCRRNAASVVIAAPPGAPPAAMVEIAHCKGKELGGAPFTRFTAAGDALRIPDGCFGARVVASGHAPGKWVEPNALASSVDALPVAGELRWHVSEKGTSGPLPSKLLIRGRADTKAPSFGEDREDEPVLNAVYTAGEGEVPVPPGKYHVVIQRGFEYTIFEKDIEVARDKTIEVKAELERVVDTHGFLSADLHVHAIPSFDAPTPLESRIRSLAGVGVEVAVATDHNKVTDYGPAIARLSYQSRIAGVIGDEVTTKDVYFGHFNAFPLVAGGPPVDYDGIPPKELFASARKGAPPGSPSIIQVNHPRMGSIGYFELLHMDALDIKGFLSRAPLADMQFDAIEVFNGDHYDNIPKVERVMADWYALLDAGFKDTATGNSDSHKAAYQEAGVPRNYVAMPSDDPAKFDQKAFVEAIKQHRVIVSSGPFVRLSANGHGIGDTIDPGTAEVSIHVEAPPWVDVDKVELVRRGEVIATFKVDASEKAVRFDKKMSVDLASGDWIIAIARGTKPMNVLHRKAAIPFAFTNPIFAR